MPNMAPKRIFIIRHGEKPDDTTAGIDLTGLANPHSLTPVGWQRAGALVGFFAPHDGVFASPLLHTPDALIAPNYGSLVDDSIHRTHQTIAPLAERLGIKITATLPTGNEADLIRQAIFAGGADAPLICWDHQHIPAMLAEFAAMATIDPTPTMTSWPDDRYDVVLVLTRTGDGADGKANYEFAQIPQMLLPGDAATSVG